MSSSHICLQKLLAVEVSIIIKIDRYSVFTVMNIIGFCEKLLLKNKHKQLICLGERFVVFWLMENPCRYRALRPFSYNAADCISPYEYCRTPKFYLLRVFFRGFPVLGLSDIIEFSDGVKTSLIVFLCPW